MTALSGLYRRLESLIHELAKFGIVGAFNFALYFGLFNLLLHRGLGSVTSNVIATVISATSSYFMNRHWSFRHRARSGLRREYTLFFLLNGVGLLISSGVIGFTDHVLGRDTTLALNVASVLGQVIGTVFRFATYKKFVFLAPAGEAGTAAEAAWAGGPGALPPETHDEVHRAASRESGERVA